MSQQHETSPHTRHLFERSISPHSCRGALWGCYWIGGYISWSRRQGKLFRGFSRVMGPAAATCQVCAAYCTSARWYDSLARKEEKNRRVLQLRRTMARGFDAVR